MKKEVKAIMITTANYDMCKLSVRQIRTFSELPIVIIVDDNVEEPEKFKKLGKVVTRTCLENEAKRRRIDGFVKQHKYAICLLCYIAVEKTKADKILLVEDDVFLDKSIIGMFKYNETTFTAIKSNIWNRFGGRQSSKLLENERQLQSCVDSKISKKLLQDNYHNGGVKLICSEDFDFYDYYKCLSSFYGSKFFESLNDRFRSCSSGMKVSYQIICERFENDFAMKHGLTNVDYDLVAHRQDELSDRTVKKIVNSGKSLHYMTENKKMVLRQFKKAGE